MEPKNRKKGSDRRPVTGNQTAARVVIVCLVIGSVVTLGFLLQRESQDRSAASYDRAQLNPATATGSDGTIRFAGEHCREFQIDNRTGRVSEKHRVDDCKETKTPSDPKELMKSRYSSGRLESIRDSFSGR
jgi:hypothetical protein